MDTAFVTCLVIVAAMLGLFARQYRASARQRARLAACVLVNGIRGKSSVTRLIAAGLRAGGAGPALGPVLGPVLGKTTGTSARWLLPDGTEKSIRRNGPANIREMAAGLALAEELGAAVYVAECMAIRPEYQAVVERWMRADVTVMTNIRPDHEDVFGAGRPAVAKGLAAGLPSRGMLVAFPETIALLNEARAFSQDRTVAADPDLGREWLHLFGEPVIEDNLALALTVCSLLGVAPEQAARAMAGATPDPGALERKTIAFKGRTVDVVGAFAANDPESTLFLARTYPPKKDAAKGVWLHARPDRRQRTEVLSAALRTLEPDFVIVSGDAEFAARQWRGVELKHGMFRLGPDDETELETALDAVPGDIWLFGAGNAKGLTPRKLGEDFVCQRLSSA